MKTKPFIRNGTLGFTPSAQARSSGGKGSSGYITKVALVALVLVGLAAAGFILRVKGKSLSESVLPALSQGIPAASSEELSPMPTATPDAGEGSQAVPAAKSASTANTLPATAAKAVNPAEPKVAPTGMVYLAKRITVTKETGIVSFPKGTLVVVKSKAGGKIRGSIQGVNVELSEAEATTILQE